MNKDDIHTPESTHPSLFAPAFYMCATNASPLTNCWQCPRFQDACAVWDTESYERNVDSSTFKQRMAAWRQGRASSSPSLLLSMLHTEMRTLILNVGLGVSYASLKVRVVASSDCMQRVWYVATVEFVVGTLWPPLFDL